MKDQTWEESIATAIENDIHEILHDRGIYDCGKNFLEDVEKRIIPRIIEAREETAQWYKTKKTGKLGREDMVKSFNAGRLAALEEAAEAVENLKHGFHNQTTILVVQATIRAIQGK